MKPITPRSFSATVNSRLAMLASRQSSVFSRSQGLEIGMTDSTMQRRVRSGHLDRPYPGVYRIAASTRTWLQEVWSAYLAVGPGAVITHETALYLDGIRMLPKRPITLTVAHGGHARLKGVVVHQIDDLRDSRVLQSHGLPVSSVERTLVELAATRREKELGRVIDTAITDRHTTSACIGEAFMEVLRPGKPGMRKLARILDGRGDGYVPPASELERALFAALAAGGLPPPRRQAQLPGRGAIDGLVDGMYDDARLILEADGRRWHTRIDQIKRDHERDTEAARAGYLTVRFLYEQIMYEPREVCAAVADILHSRRILPRQ